MSILLCAATDLEIAPTIDYLKTSGTDDVEILITGVGLMSATYHFTKKLTTLRPSMVIQAGVAGALENNLFLSQVVLVQNEMIGDMGVLENGHFRSLIDLQLIHPSSFPWIDGRLENKDIEKYKNHLQIVDGVTVNEISTNKDRIAHFRNLGVSIETMEGAALHYVCLHEMISFMQIRGISNYIGERDKSQWKLKEAISSLNVEVQKLITKQIV